MNIRKFEEKKMAGQLGGQPILILREGTERTRGKDAQSRNILAAKAVSSAVRTTLGPRGMDKMLVDSMGDVVITNDGATILKEMDIEHPAAKMMVEVAKTMDEEVGDGTTTAVVLAGELLKRAEDLIDLDVHQTVISSGYRLAAEKSSEILEEIATEISVDDEAKLKRIAETSMTGKGAEVAKENLADLTVRAIRLIVEEDGTVDIDNVKVEKKMGGSIDETEFIDGIVIDKEVVHPNMPKKVEDAKIALINSALEIEKTEVDAEIEITSAEQMRSFMDEEERMLKDMVDKIVKTGANVVLCQKGIDDLVQHYLSKEGVLTVRRVKESDMKKLARAAGGRISTSVKDLVEDDLGSAKLVEERKVGDDEMVFIEGCTNPRAVTILLRGGTEHVVDEIERGLHDALSVVSLSMENKKVVAGGGASEVEVALRLKEYAAKVGGREQLAIEAFANSLEIIPRTLAENAGLDPIDMLVDLRYKHESGEKNAGLDMINAKVINTMDAGVVEPLRVKTQSISSASEAAVMILRIDDVISAKTEGMGPRGPPGGPGEEEMEY
jgi:thermosome